jgi:hypothetical protein
VYVRTNNIFNILMVLNVTLTEIRVQKHSQNEDRFSKYTLEEWGHAVAQLVEALRYKPEGCGFERSFSLTQSFRPQHPRELSTRNIC